MLSAVDSVDYLVIFNEAGILGPRNLFLDLSRPLIKNGLAPVSCVDCSEFGPNDEFHRFKKVRKVAGDYLTNTGTIASDRSACFAIDSEFPSALGVRLPNVNIDLTLQIGQINNLPSNCYGVDENDVFISAGAYARLFLRFGQPLASSAVRPRNREQDTSRDYFLVTGAADHQSGSLDRVARANLTISTSPLPETGDICVEAEANGARLARACIRRSSAMGDVTPLVFLLPYDERADRISLFIGSEEVAFRAASLGKPTVEVTSPSSGSRLDASAPFRLSWTASDPDGGTLEFIVSYSSNGGQSWVPLRLSTTQN